MRTFSREEAGGLVLGALRIASLAVDYLQGADVLAAGGKDANDIDRRNRPDALQTSPHSEPDPAVCREANPQGARRQSHVARREGTS